jgi:regulation of enolase protein 1 (concanavalin A-like superfamily)
MEWFNEPREWADEDVLRVVADAQTDLWQKTHYGYTTDTGHIYGQTVTGDVTVRATFSADYAEQYDQAGAALRIDAENWIKAGTEFVDGALHISVVVTRGFSDWSVLPAPGLPASVTIELERAGDAVTVRYGLDGGDPAEMLRLAYFPPEVPVLAGVMCAAPVGKGFETRFTGVEIRGIA